MEFICPTFHSFGSFEGPYYLWHTFLARKRVNGAKDHYAQRVSFGCSSINDGGAKWAISILSLFWWHNQVNTSKKAFNSPLPTEYTRADTPVQPGMIFLYPLSPLSTVTLRHVWTWFQFAPCVPHAQYMSVFFICLTATFYWFLLFCLCVSCSMSFDGWPGLLLHACCHVSVWI